MYLSFIFNEGILYLLLWRYFCIRNTCGNICAIITDDLVSKFRPNFFKHIHKTSEIAVTQFKKLK